LVKTIGNKRGERPCKEEEIGNERSRRGNGDLNRLLPGGNRGTEKKNNPSRERSIEVQEALEKTPAEAQFRKQ